MRKILLRAKRVILTLVTGGAFFVQLSTALAGSATWIQDGGIWSDVNTWDPNTVPNDPSHIATFTSDVGAFASGNVDGTFSVATLNFTTAFNFFLNSGMFNVYDSILVAEATGGANCNTTISLQDDISIVTDAQFSANSIVGTGDIIKTGASVLRVADTSTYSGTTYVNEGTFQAGAEDAFSHNSAIVLANVAGVELNNQGIPNTILSLAGGGNLGGEVTFDNAGAGSLTLGDASNTTFAGIISGEGEIIKQGSGTFTLSGANTYTEGTTLSAGALVLGANAALGTGALAMADGTTLYVNDAVSVSNAVTLAGTGNIGVSSGTGTLSGVIGGAEAELTKVGDGELVLSNTNTYGGGTTVSAGTLSLESADNIGGEDAELTLAGGTLAASGDLTLSGDISVTADSGMSFEEGVTASLTGTVSGADEATLTLSGDGDYSITGEVEVGNSDIFTIDGLAGSTALTKTGTGTLVLNLASNYTRDVVISAGSLIVTDPVAPSAPGEVAATVDGSTIDLSWENPSDVDFDSVTIRVSSEDYPSSITDGDLLAEDLNAETSYSSSGLTAGTTYYFSLFAKDIAGNASSAATASASIAAEDADDSPQGDSGDFFSCSLNPNSSWIASHHKNCFLFALIFFIVFFSLKHKKMSVANG